MRVFSDEINSGMMELLIVRPISFGQLIWAKFLAMFIVVILSILPTLVYIYSVYKLGSPVGNLDWGATVGSFVGLFAVSTAFTAIALMASALSSNTIVSLIVGIIMIASTYVGFDFLAFFYKFLGLELTISSFGMNEHYRSMARGVLDLRDLGYFIGITFIFHGLTYGIVSQDHIKNSWRRASIWVVAGVFIALGFQSKRIRWDLTEEKRYSLSRGTESLIDRIDEPLLITVYLEGKFPAGFERLQIETRSLLEEWEDLNRNVYFEFIDPNNVESPDEFKRQLATKGINAVQLQVINNNGESILNVFPGATMAYKEKEVTFQLLSNVMTSNPDEQVNISIDQLEFNLARALNALLVTDKPKVGMVTGHGELTAAQTAGIGRALSENYAVDRFSLQAYKADANGEADLSDMVRRMNTYDLLVVAKPTQPFPELDKYLLDQFLMGGGKVLWFLDGVHAEMDSLSFGPEFLAYPTIYDLNLTDLLFKYGVRINADLVQDVRCAGVNDRRSINPWVYFPLWVATDHPAIANMNAVKGEFSSTLDTVEAPGIKKTPLLLSSANARSMAAPHTVSLEMLYNRPDPRAFTQKNLLSAVLMEGSFESAYANRLAPKTGVGLPQLKKSPQTAMAVFSDGDFIRNQVNLINPEIPRGQPYPLGYDQFVNIQYGNDDLILNIVNYMLDDIGLMETRTRDIKLRPLNQSKLEKEANYWKFLNVALPELVLALAAFIFFLQRKRRYARR